ncbi:MAG TPA: hypothetical protein VFA79_10220 [Myxococcales bacterium]|nr:hypothetical protein [Myxococcales bacterium]
MTRVEFHAKRPARTQRCQGRGCGPHGHRATSWQHWLPQQALRVYVSGLRLPESEARAVLRRLLADERNLSPFCHRFHLASRGGRELFTREMVPVSAWEFARELGEAYVARLERAYPMRRS